MPKKFNKTEVLKSGQIQVRQIHTVVKGGKVVSEVFHRHVIEPDHADITDQDEEVQAVAKKAWTAKVKKDWLAKKQL